MDLQGIREALHRQPFKPFDIRLADGRSVLVHHPDFVAVGKRRIIVVEPDDSWSEIEPLLIVSLDYPGTMLEPPLWGVWIVKLKDKKCQLSCQIYSYALRHLQNGRWIELDRGKNDEKKIRSILSQVRVIKKAPRRNRNDISFWEKFFSDLGDC